MTWLLGEILQLLFDDFKMNLEVFGLLDHHEGGPPNVHYIHYFSLLWSLIYLIFGF